MFTKVQWTVLGIPVRIWTLLGVGGLYGDFSVEIGGTHRLLVFFPNMDRLVWTCVPNTVHRPFQKVQKAPAGEAPGRTQVKKNQFMLLEANQRGRHTRLGFFSFSIEQFSQKLLRESIEPTVLRRKL